MSNVKQCLMCSLFKDKIVRGLCPLCYASAKYYGTIDGYSTKFIDATRLNLTPIQEEFITGALLGDGFISKIDYGRKNSNFGIDRKLDDLEYLKWQFSFIENFCSRDIYIRDRYNKRTGKTHKHCIFETRFLPIFSKFRNLWYPNGKKIIPNELKLSTLIMQIWYCDDGTLDILDSGNFRIKFATNGFTKDEVIFLSDLLKNRYGGTFSINKDGKNFRLVAGTKIAPVILNDISKDHPPMPRKFLI